MSVVVWDGETLAADKQCARNETTFTTHKLWKLGNKEALAFIGFQSTGLALKRWYKSGAKRED